jgi:NAD(P)-dependent dehydrogenase (short-subunit alcohol dehydrogenase family)
MFNQDLSGKVYVITGGASGMGLALVRLLSARGASLSIADLNTRGLADIEAELAGKNSSHMYTTLDISKEAEVNRWIDATLKRFGYLNGAANCAGILGTTKTAMPLTEIETENWDLCLAVNLTGELFLIQSSFGFS